MLFRSKVVLLGLATLWLGGFTSHAYTLVEDFSSDPSATWSFGIGDNSNAQFDWNSGAPAQYTGDSVGSLGVHFDSSLPTARYQRPLGVTVNNVTDFTLTTRFNFDLTQAGPDDFMQIAFGLVNSTETGGNRTGTHPSFGDADTFHAVEFNYYPNVAVWGGPTLSPAVFGEQVGSLDIFGNFAAVFGPGADLGDNGPGFITSLPEGVVLEAEMDFNSALQTLTLTLSQVNPDGTLTPLSTGVPSLSLAFGGTPFSVDTLAIMAYFDAADTDDSSVSLIADATFERLEFFAPIPEPQSLAVFAGLMLAAYMRHGKRKS